MELTFIILGHVYSLNVGCYALETTASSIRILCHSISILRYSAVYVRLIVLLDIRVHIWNLLITILALIFIIKTQLPDPKANPAEFDDVSQLRIHPIILFDVVLVLLVAHHEPRHLDVVLVRVIFYRLVVEQPVLTVLVGHAYQVLNLRLIPVLVYFLLLVGEARQLHIYSLALPLNVAAANELIF